MNARLRVPCPEWGDRSQRAFQVDVEGPGAQRPQESGSQGGEGNFGELDPEAAGPALGPCRRPEGGRSAKKGLAAGSPKVAAEAVAAGGPFCRSGGRRQKLEAGRAQRLEQGYLRHYWSGAASRAAKEVQKSFQTHGGPGVTAICGRSSGLTETRSTIWS